MMGKKDTFAELARPVRFLGPVLASLVAAGVLIGGVGTARAQQCLLPENGSGTVDLPVECTGGYGNPEDYHVLTDGLPAGSSIRFRLTWRFQNVVREPGGNFKNGEIQTFMPSIFSFVEGTGELESINYSTPLVNAFGEEHSGDYPDFSPQQTIDLEMVELRGEGRSFDPYFRVLRYEVGSRLGLPATLGEANLQLDRPGECVGGQADGQPCARDNQCPDSNNNGICEGGDNDGQPCITTINCPGGECWNRGSCSCPGGPCVPSYVTKSFFDVEYAIEYEGKETGPLAGLSGRSTGTIRLYAGAFPAVFMRPRGGSIREITVAAGDTFVIDTYVRQLVPSGLSAYQVTCPIEATPISAGARGSITHVPQERGPACDQTREDWVYYGLSSQPTVSCTFTDVPICLAFFFSPPAEGYPVVEGQKYLGEFTYDVSLDAAGDFEIPFVEPCDRTDCQTSIADEEWAPMPFEPYSAIVHVTGDGDPVPGPPVLVHGTGDVDETYPCTGYIDPGLESDNGVDLNLGVNQVIMVFNEPVFKVGGAGTTPADTTSFIVAETGGGAAPDVIDVSTSDNISYTVTLDRFITLQEWTTIRADVVDTVGNAITNNGDEGAGVAEPDRLDIAFLPDDVDQTGVVSPEDDLISLRDFLTAGSFHNACVDILYFDIDGDGEMPEPQDLIRFRQMISGVAPATWSWASAMLNNTQP